MGITLAEFLMINSNSSVISVRSVDTSRSHLADDFIYDVSDDLGVRWREAIW